MACNNKHTMFIGEITRGWFPLSRAFNADGEVVKVKGYVEATDLSKPGQLTLHLDGVPDIFGAPYWIVALGDEDGVSMSTSML